MKYIVMLGDGMADLPLEEIGGKTPLDVAKKPNIDGLAKKAIAGMVKTVPDGLQPGSDVANLSVMGYNPLDCYTGRSPLEAVSMGINLLDSDVAIRCNIVTLSEEKEYADRTMLDYSAGEITTDEAKELILAVQEALGTDEFKFNDGISYRHCLVWNNGVTGLELIPPHDISDKKITGYLPKNEKILDLMVKSYDVLKNHPINKSRIERGLKPGNSIWLWGEGTKPAVFNFSEHYGVKGAVISAVDLLMGIGISAGMKIIKVEGATGNEHTNFKGKCEAAFNALTKENCDFVYIHVEAPDECGHRGDLKNKIYSIEKIDEEIVGPLLKKLSAANEEYSIMVLPDHPTPVALKTHTMDLVPFLLYRSNEEINSGIDTYSETACASTGKVENNGYKLMGQLLQRD
jgi:proposed homoserine kinase